MLYALKDGIRIRPTETGQTAFCEICNGAVISKCGRINIWHWAHTSGGDCDEWSEPLSMKHESFQNGMEQTGFQIEVPISKNGKTHRADALSPNGTVVEIQCSSISPEDIEARELFYDNMVWLFEVELAYYKKRFLIREKANYCSFRWKHPVKSLFFTTKPVFLYLGAGQMFKINKIHPNIPCGGWGVKTTWGDFLNELLAT